MQNSGHHGVDKMRRRFTATRAAFLLLVAFIPGAAPEPDTRPHGDTPERIAFEREPEAATVQSAKVVAGASRPEQGDVLFHADFDQGSMAGLVFDRENVWSVVDGRLRAALPSRKQVRSLATLAVPVAGDYAVELDVLGVRGVDKGVVVGIEDGKGVGVDLRAGTYEDLLVYRGFSQLGRAPVPNRNGRWYHLRVEVAGGRLRVHVDRALKLDVAAGDASRGRIALAAYTGGVGECTLLFDNVVVTRLGRDTRSATGT